MDASAERGEVASCAAEDEGVPDAEVVAHGDAFVVRGVVASYVAEDGDVVHGGVAAAFAADDVDNNADAEDNSAGEIVDTACMGSGPSDGGRAVVVVVAEVQHVGPVDSSQWVAAVVPGTFAEDAEANHVAVRLDVLGEVAEDVVVAFAADDEGNIVDKGNSLDEIVDTACRDSGPSDVVHAVVAAEAGRHAELVDNIQ